MRCSSDSGFDRDWISASATSTNLCLLIRANIRDPTKVNAAAINRVMGLGGNVGVGVCVCVGGCILGIIDGRDDMEGVIEGEWEGIGEGNVESEGVYEGRDEGNAEVVGNGDGISVGSDEGDNEDVGIDDGKPDGSCEGKYEGDNEGKFDGGDESFMLGLPLPLPCFLPLLLG